MGYHGIDAVCGHCSSSLPTEIHADPCKQFINKTKCIHLSYIYKLVEI